MSGGVDSSVAAALLQRAGHDVVGVFMRLGSPGETLDQPMPYDEAEGAACETKEGSTRIHHQGCCSIGDAHDARLVAAELGIPFYVCNFKKDFGRIIDYFVAEYAAGRTPNPCVRCNDWLKFGKLHDYARTLGAEMVASGHYARVDRTGAEPRLLRGVDADKDQSYVLFGVGRGQLDDMLLPIGEHEKPAVREMAERFGLPVFDKPDSQEICFVPDNDYARLVEERRPGLAKAGRIEDTEGRVLGEHAGHHRFTVGQRRGVGVALGHPIYVVEKDARTNRVVVGTEDNLFCAGCVAGEVSWLGGGSMPDAWTPCLAKYRYNGRAVHAEFRRGSLPEAGPRFSAREGKMEVRFVEPQRAVAPGQAVVVYDASDPDWVLGGGWIATTTTSPAAIEVR